MSLFSKLFKPKAPQTFVLHGITFDTLPGQDLLDGDYFWADIDFETPFACYVWMLPQTREEDETAVCLPGAYMASDEFAPGRHRIRRWFYKNEIDTAEYPDGINLIGAQINVEDEAGNLRFSETRALNHRYLPLTEAQLAERRQADAQGLQMEVVSVTCHGVELSPHDTIGVDADIRVRLRTECNEAVSFTGAPNTALPFAYQPTQKPNPANGLVDLEWKVHAPGQVDGFTIKAWNRYEMEIACLVEDFPLRAEKRHGEGVSSPVRLDFYGIFRNEANAEGLFDYVPPQSEIGAAEGVQLYCYLNHQAEHGAVFWVYDLVGGETDEKRFQSCVFTYEESQEQDYLPSFALYWTRCNLAEGEIREISGFYLCLTNTVGEILAESKVNFPLRIRG